MADESREPVVCRALQRYIHELAKALDPVTLSTELFSREIIDERTWDEARREPNGANYDRSLVVLGALLRAMRASPSHFEELLDILRSEVTSERLATKLEGEVKRLQDITNNRGTSKDETSLSRSREEEERDDPPCGKRKQRLIIKSGKIKNADKLLMEVAREICDKWEEVGIALTIDFKVLKSVIGGDATKPDHTKAFHMLQEWKSRAGEKFTYDVLSSALEDCGLNLCAQQHCYTAYTENEQ